MNESVVQPSPPSMRGLFVPMLLLALSVVLWFGFQTYQLVNERQQLAALRASQDAQVEGATKLRASLDTLATATAQLADSGNASARIIVEELRKRGITIKPAAPR